MNSNKGFELWSDFIDVILVLKLALFLIKHIYIDIKCVHKFKCMKGLNININKLHEILTQI